MKIRPGTVLARVVNAARPTRPWLRIHPSSPWWARVLITAGARQADIELDDAPAPPLEEVRVRPRSAAVSNLDPYEDQDSPPTLSQLLAPLESLTGLRAAKESVRSLVWRLELARRRDQGDLLIPHAVFLGPPGTGKTIVAREVGRILRDLGLLSRGHVVEVTRENLVSGYVGQSAIATLRMIEEAEGGVLFIDEPYSLTRGGGTDSDHEAIDTLVQEMDNRRGRMLVILAGYPDEMQQMMTLNPGLASRIHLRISFPVYSLDELHGIFTEFASERGLTLGPGVADRVRDWFDSRINGPYFSNARAARDLLESIETRIAERVMADEHADPHLILAEDIPDDAPSTRHTTLNPV
ncbi:AAA family ATPase [Sphaerisporangium aureirubrum]|uniref:AAA family ATPase n=1 Tax=Sphaerisporangium aureirubrum TaxID=1544736 RepID=A0ABW1NIF3_9ACTN